VDGTALPDPALLIASLVAKPSLSSPTTPPPPTTAHSTVTVMQLSFCSTATPSEATPQPPSWTTPLLASAHLLSPSPFRLPPSLIKLPSC
jgi:hypothetical protein